MELPGSTVPMMAAIWVSKGMIEDVIKQCDYSLNGNGDHKKPMTLPEVKDVRKVARLITNAENGQSVQRKSSQQENTCIGYYRYRRRRKKFCYR
jgi:hypothetical protein